MNVRILICAYIPVADLFRTVVVVTKRWSQALFTPDMLKELLRVNIGLNEPTNLQVSSLVTLLKTNAPGCYRSSRPMEVTGFAVSSGDDQSYEPQWLPAYLFYKEAKGYSCASTDGNAVVGGFLNPVFATLSKEIEAKAKDVGVTGLLRCSRRDLVQEVEVPDKGDMRYIGCVHGVYLSRRGVFSCPVSSFVLFTSVDKMTVSSGEFERYFNLTTGSEVCDRFRDEVVRAVSTEKFELIEFRPNIAPLQPVVWGKFTAKRCTTINQRLKGRFLGRFFYLLLVDAENRLRQYRDFHSKPNIDVHCVNFFGRVITLYH